MTNGDDPATVGLMALAWILSDTQRADRLLGLTGLDADSLRTSAGDDSTLAAVIRFLESYEPDLIACADAIGSTPTGLVASRERLEA